MSWTLLNSNRILDYLATPKSREFRVLILAVMSSQAIVAGSLVLMRETDVKREIDTLLYNDYLVDQEATHLHSTALFDS